jgi:hypothetical protein
MSPTPTAILTYYGITSISDPFFHTTHQMGPAPLQYHQVQSFYDESITLGSTLPSKKFDPNCLLPDLTRNLIWKKPEPELPNQRIRLVPWFLQEVLFPKMLGIVDVDLKDQKWKEFPPTILVHGDQDRAAPYECSVRLIQAIGEYCCV